MRVETPFLSPDIISPTSKAKDSVDYTRATVSVSNCTSLLPYQEQAAPLALDDTRPPAYSTTPTVLSKRAVVYFTIIRHADLCRFIFDAVLALEILIFVQELLQPLSTPAAPVTAGVIHFRCNARFDRTPFSV